MSHTGINSCTIGVGKHTFAGDIWNVACLQCISTDWITHTSCRARETGVSSWDPDEKARRHMQTVSYRQCKDEWKPVPSHHAQLRPGHPIAETILSRHVQAFTNHGAQHRMQYVDWCHWRRYECLDGAKS